MKKNFKPRVEHINPTSIVDVWRLFEKSQLAAEQGLKSALDECSPSDIRHYLLDYLMKPNFVGVMLKMGRRPIGQIIGHIERRVLEKPKTFFFAWNVWVEPEFRSKGMMQLLSKECGRILKEKDIHVWECSVPEERSKWFEGREGFKAEKIYVRMRIKI